MKYFESLKAGLFTIVFMLFSYLTVKAQLPDGVDAGQSDEAVSIYQQPKYIIPLVIFIIILIIFFFWQKRNKK